MERAGGLTLSSMSAVDDILSRIPLADLAARLGVDESTAEQAARQALPALLGGMQANATDPRGAASLASALQQHDDGLVDGGVDLRQVDEGDGDKIVGHVFGGQREQVVQQLGNAPGPASQDLIAKLLPILAPIVMSWLVKKLGGGGHAGGGRLGDLLGSVLGGAGGKQGGMLGGGLGDLLGDLLGGGRRA
jgi:hypothetical protein